MKKLPKKLTLRKETLLNLRHVASGRMAAVSIDQEDRTTAPSSGVVEICYFSDCNPCDTQAVCTQYN